MVEEKRQRLLVLALEVFFKHGYRRVEMKEIAEVAGISRPGLYLYFKTKEEIFSAAILHYSDNKLAEIAALGKSGTTAERLVQAFEIWCVRGFDRSLKSPETREVSDCSLEFARGALDESYGKFEKVVAGIVKEGRKRSGSRLSPDRTARLLVSSVRGFKVVARSGAELRQMIKEMIGEMI